MPMLKKGLTATAPVATAPAAEAPKATVAASTDSGTKAAVGRLQKKADTTAAPAATTKSSYQPRDFDKEARGKTRCVQFEAALMSPAIAGMKFDTIEQYLALCKQAAEAGVAYTFGE